MGKQWDLCFFYCFYGNTPLHHSGEGEKRRLEKCLFPWACFYVSVSWRMERDSLPLNDQGDSKSPEWMAGTSTWRPWGASNALEYPCKKYSSLFTFYSSLIRRPVRGFRMIVSTFTVNWKRVHGLKWLSFKSILKALDPVFYWTSMGWH